MKHSSFDATISALDAETSALDVETSPFGAVTSAIARRSFDATISTLDAETSALDAETSAIARSYRRYRRGVSGDIGDCGVGVTPQMCNRVTNNGDMSTFSKPALSVILIPVFHTWLDLELLVVDWSFMLSIEDTQQSDRPELRIKLFQLTSRRDNLLKQITLKFTPILIYMQN